MSQVGAITKSFENHFSELNNKKVLAILRNFYRLRLIQYKLLGKYEPDDILNQAIERLSIAEKSGKRVYNLVPWLRTTGLHIILEISRQEIRRRVVDNKNFDFEELLPDERSQYSCEDTELYKCLSQALKELDISERKLVIMRYYRQLGWQEIAKILSVDGVTISTEALRKRGSRALEKLRKIFKNKYLQD